ncbi:UbiA family prenyltransferase [Pseudomonas stutzeri]|uniref:1,4-dihydroxy-2-naphthoate octaprenyltransferase n=1 Tax=Stutzerimonas stutzeri TaxID=316 RepID=A0A2N8S5U0_STUST|nr:UbiA family prenyltransferase [Stutzerimonas stutzeri]MCQ4296973.1 UbiA family prenyltransferase [Stutzerimonas stutzeri]PNF81987.1 1,4-dihydroxy-2-naphthoate octaprenyltransferase [Stutzerimonas stutzeri]
MSGTWDWLGVVRGRFLLLTLSCVALGLALAARGRSDAVPVVDAVLVLLGALAAHAAVNALNEWSDYRSGLDLRTRRTAFSGGSGTLLAHPHLLGRTLLLGLGSLLGCALIGLFFLLRQPQLTLSLAPLGLAGLLLVVVYTPWLTRHPWLCLFAPGLGFALMVLGTRIVLGGPPNTGDLLLILPALLLCNNLLLLGQFPDIEADRAVGRRTLPMHIGVEKALHVALVQWLLTYGVLLAMLTQPGLSGAALGLLSLPLALRAAWLLRREPLQAQHLLPALGLNAAVSVATPLLMAVGLLAL